MYKIAFPILGFEDFKALTVEKVDEFFSFLVFDKDTKAVIVGNVIK